MTSAAAAPADGATFDAWAGQRLGQPHSNAAGAAAAGPDYHNISSNPGSPAREAGSNRDAAGRWRLYDEKWMLSGDCKYNASSTKCWRQGKKYDIDPHTPAKQKQIALSL